MQLFFISIVPPFTPSFQLCAYYPNFPSKLEFRSILTFHESRNYVEQFYLDTGPRRIQLRSACLSSAAQLVVCNMFSEASDKLGNIWPKLSLLPGQDNHSRSSFMVDSFHARELWLVTIFALVRPRISSGASCQCLQVPVDPRRCIQAEYCGLHSKLDGQLLVVRCNTQLRLSLVSTILRPPRSLGWLIIL